MYKLAKEYKDISLKILYDLENKRLEKIDELLDERQKILESVIDTEGFKNNLINEDIIGLDKNIKILLNENIELTKQEIKEHNLSKRANVTYGITRNKLNIFNKKV